MDKMKEERFAQDFAGKVSKDNDKHDTDMKTMQAKQRAILEGQSRTMIRDENEIKKHAAVNNMKKAYDRAEEVRQKEETLKQQHITKEKNSI